MKPLGSQAAPSATMPTAPHHNSQIVGNFGIFLGRTQPLRQSSTSSKAVQGRGVKPWNGFCHEQNNFVRTEPNKRPLLCSLQKWRVGCWLAWQQPWQLPASPSAFFAAITIVGPPPTPTAVDLYSRFSLLVVVG